MPGPQATAWINGKKISINKAKMLLGAFVYKNIVGQVVGKTKEGFIVKTGDTILEIMEYTYTGKIRVRGRLSNYE